MALLIDVELVDSLRCVRLMAFQRMICLCVLILSYDLAACVHDVVAVLLLLLLMMMVYRVCVAGA